MPTLKEWFCLKDTRDNFKLKVREDANLVLCHKEAIDEILGAIERRFATNEPIKMIIWGDWGVGKTHAANHISWWLKQHMDDFPAMAVMIEIGDLEKKSRFDVLVRPFLEEFGMPQLIELTGQYQQKVMNVVAGLRDAGVSQYVAETFTRLTLGFGVPSPPPVVADAFQILQGRKPGPGFASNGLGIQITESRDFYYVLSALGEMYRVVKGHRLLFIADEAAKLEDVSNDETTEAHWISANRDIFDDKNSTFGFIYTLTAKSNRLPRALWDPQIQNRIGQSVYELRNLAKLDVVQFLASLVGELVDTPKVQNLVDSGEIEKNSFDKDSYPFTAPAKNRFVEFFQRSQENSKPRDICDRLDLLGFLAMKAGSRLIDEVHLQKANM